MKGDKAIALKGGFWTSVSTAVTMLAQIARIVILTRILEKSDFGLVSITNMVTMLCVTFTDLGFASVIMYKRDLTQREFSSLYWVQFLSFGLIYGVLVAITPLVSDFYSEPSLSTLLPLAGLSIIFQAVGKLYESVLQKNYEFKLIAIRNIIANFISLFVAVWLAYKGFGVYSLVYSTLCNIIIYNVWNLIAGVKIIRVVFVLNFKEVIPLIKIGLYQTGVRVLDFFSGKIDVLLIGKLLGTEALGLYDLSKELVYKLVYFIQTVVSKVALPILSNNNNDDNVVISRFLQVTKIVAYVCMPICSAIAVFSEPAVRIMYGVNYLEAAPLVSVFAIVTMFTSIVSFMDMLGVVKGRTDLNFKGTAYHVIIAVAIVAVTCFISILAVAIGQLLIVILSTIVGWYIIVKPNYGIRIKDYIQQFSKLFIILAIISTLTILIDSLLCSNINNWIVGFVVKGVLFGILFCTCIAVFLKEDLAYFSGLLGIKKRTASRGLSKEDI
ncbi:MAG: lipopolysaccharide biosynthesis protein [Bacteroidales bacterium]|nr:lipopolysaccharide biosynthesis protein [Bacteroidales bacterium]